MFAQSKKYLSMLLMSSMLFTMSAGVASAQDTTVVPGEGPSTAVQPSEGEVTIAPNTWQWYVIRSQVPVRVDSEGNDIVNNFEDAIIDATLRTKADNIDFEVWSAQNLNDWLASEEFDPTGAGTENEFITGDPLFWQGAFETNDNLYLIVMNRSGAPANYTLSVTGDVRFPSELRLDSVLPSVQDLVAPTDISVMSTGEMALTVETPTEAAMTQYGTGPENTLMPADGIVMIEPGQWQWYSFRSQVPVRVDSEGEDVVNNSEDAIIDALLRAQSGNVDFEVWSAQNLNDWRNGEDFDAVGGGTENEFITGDPLFWQGAFERNTTYYLIVKNNTTQPAYYSLNITGDVSFPSAATLSVN